MRTEARKQIGRVFWIALAIAVGLTAIAVVLVGTFLIPVSGGSDAGVVEDPGGIPEDATAGES